MPAKALYLPHGGGPMPLLGDPSHASMVEYLERSEAELGRPDAIVVVSAHWERPQPAITAAAAPGLYFDYYGFPPETYEYEYPAPGSPELADQLAALLREAGFDPVLNTARDFDHGMFVPLMLMYPDASIPVVQLSLLDDLDAARHIALGEAIAPLLAGEVLLVGSGMSFHNMRAFGPGPDPQNDAFDAWLERVCTDPDLPETERRAQLADWDRAPGARHNHPREEHLLPLHVCYGASGRAAHRSFDGETIGKRVAAYLWN